MQQPVASGAVPVDYFSSRLLVDYLSISRLISRLFFTVSGIFAIAFESKEPMLGAFR